MFACHLFGVDRQVYYRSINRKFVKQIKASHVVNLVNKLRMTQPKIGGKKLYYLLINELKSLKIGRDIFFNILRANRLLVLPKRSYHVTTNSHHRFRKHSNLILDMQISKPEQVWVSDITYIGKRTKPCYLSLVTDAYSKKIMGYHVADNLNAESTLEALKMAKKQRSYKESALIHHSDRGLQYCSDQYQKALTKSKIRCSMTQHSDPYENAVAERVNGILKQEFLIDTYHHELATMRQIVKESISIYNDQRPHYSNHLLTPTQMHNQNLLEMRTYKTKSSNRPKPITARKL